jgi:hypothetical protein
MAFGLFIIHFMLSKSLKEEVEDSTPTLVLGCRFTFWDFADLKIKPTFCIDI